MYVQQFTGPSSRREVHPQRGPSGVEAVRMEVKQLWMAASDPRDGGPRSLVLWSLGSACLYTPSTWSRGRRLQCQFSAPPSVRNPKHGWRQCLCPGPSPAVVHKVSPPVEARAPNAFDTHVFVEGCSILPQAAAPSSLDSPLLNPISNAPPARSTLAPLVRRAAPLFPLALTCMPILARRRSSTASRST